MLSIVGTRLYMHEGDSCAFKVMYRDQSEIFDFDPAHSLSIVVRDIVTGDVTLARKSVVLDVEGVPSLVFPIYSNELPRGDYTYELILNTDTGDSYTLIDKAFINVLKSNNALPSTAYQGKIAMSKTPLICEFNSTFVNDGGDLLRGSLILFDEELKKLEDL